MVLSYISPLMSRNACSNEMTNLMNFRQTEWMFMDLTILVNLSQICQSENRRTGLTILTNCSKICQSEIRSVDLTSLLNFHQFCYCIHFWTYLGAMVGLCTSLADLKLCMMWLCGVLLSFLERSVRQSYQYGVWKFTLKGEWITLTSSLQVNKFGAICQSSSLMHQPPQANLYW